jgi:hypothetical protein
MSDHRSQLPYRVTVEDLLRLKRAERPPAEFWVGFEEQLREKQLAALVERRPWWHGVATLSARLGWMRVPVGATAILAVTLVSIRHYSASGDFRDEQLGAAIGERPVDRAKTAVAPTESKPAGKVHATASTALAAPAEKITPKNPETDAVPSVGSRVPELISEPVRRVAEVDNPVDSQDFETLATPLGLHLGTQAGGDSVLVSAAVQPIGFEDRSLSTLRPRRTAEMLPTAVAVTEQRRSRLLAALISPGAYAPEPSAPEHVRRNVIRRLSEDGWDRSMSRLQAEADHLSIRF